MITKIIFNFISGHETKINLFIVNKEFKSLRFVYKVFILIQNFKMEILNSKDLDAFKFHLVLEKATIAARFKLENEINLNQSFYNNPSTSTDSATSNNSTYVSDFLEKTYKKFVPKYRSV